MRDDADRPDSSEVSRDERLIERVNAGEGPPTGDVAGDLMARYRDAVQDPTERIRYRDPATTRLPHARYDDPRHNPIAFLPADPVPEGRVEYGGAVDYAWPTDAGDVADHNDPAAPDPTPDEITDPDHPDHVEPWTGA